MENFGRIAPRECGTVSNDAEGTAPTIAARQGKHPPFCYREPCMGQPLLDAAAEPGHSVRCAWLIQVPIEQAGRAHGQNVVFCNAAKSKKRPLLKG